MNYVIYLVSTLTSGQKLYYTGKRYASKKQKHAKRFSLEAAHEKLSTLNPVWQQAAKIVRLRKKEES